MSTPFDLQPDVVAQIRPMMSIDISRVAMLHHADMGNSLWAQLGLGFLTNLYKTLINNDRFIALHIRLVRIIPEAPTSEPEIINTG